MKTKSIRLCALVLAMVLVLTMGASALNYGQEWAGASTTATASYTDVPANHWAWDAIQRVSAKNWFSGYPDGSFRPNGTITRAEALKVFVVFLGLEVTPVTQSSFYDISPSKWYAPYIEAGKDLFPVHTTIQGKTPFQPDMPVTREDTIYALVNALGYGNDVSVVDESVLNMFTDQNSISKSLRPYFAVALQNQLVAGYNDGTIRAQNSLTRAEFATLLYRGSFVGHNDSHTAKISTVTLTPSGSAELSIGETLTLSARAVYTDGTNQAYADLQPYIASGNGIISLSGTTITALKEGTATIGFNDSYLKSQTLTITVKAPTNAPVIKITDYAATTESETVSIVGTVSDANLSTLSLTCNGKDIIPGSNGSFQTTVALVVGSNTITFVATNQYGVTAQKSIVVTRTEPAKETTVQAESISLSQTSASLTVGGTTQLSAIVSPANVTDLTVTWSSNGTSVATVNSNGVITAAAPGTAIITAKCGTVTASCTVTVTASVQTSAPTTNTYYQIKTTAEVFNGIVVYKTGNESMMVIGADNQYYTVPAVIEGEITTAKLAPALYQSLSANRFYAYTDGILNGYGVFVSLLPVSEEYSNVHGHLYADYYDEFYRGDFKEILGYNSYMFTWSLLAAPHSVESIYNAGYPAFVWNQSTQTLQKTALGNVVSMAPQTVGVEIRRKFFNGTIDTVDGLGIFLTVSSI